VYDSFLLSRSSDSHSVLMSSSQSALLCRTNRPIMAPPPTFAWGTLLFVPYGGLRGFNVPSVIIRPFLRRQPFRALQSLLTPLFSFPPRRLKDPLWWRPPPPLLARTASTPFFSQSRPQIDPSHHFLRPEKPLLARDLPPTPIEPLYSGFFLMTALNMSFSGISVPRPLLGHRQQS